MNQSLMNKLPTDVMSHIIPYTMSHNIPYTYNCHDVNFLNDIKNLIETKNEAYEIFTTMNDINGGSNWVELQYEAINNYIKNQSKHTPNYYYNVLSRHIMLSSVLNEFIDKYIESYGIEDSLQSKYKFNQLFWCLFTAKERNDIIYISGEELNYYLRIERYKNVIKERKYDL